MNAASVTIPNKEVTIRPNDVPWFNANIRKLIRSGKRLHKIAKIKNTDHHWSKFRNKRNEVTTEIRKTKLPHQQKLIDKINDSTVGPNKWFKISKTIFKLTNIDDPIPTLYLRDIQATTDNDKSNLLNRFFS